MELVALLSFGKGTWGQVSGLISAGQWEKVILVGEDYARQKFSVEDSKCEIEFVTADFNKSVATIVDDLTAKLKPKIKGVEVALSIASGEGKEHMALISALLRVPVGIKFVALTKDGIVFL
jgi:hypothetical protein